jgi:hypothetical protein
MSTPRYKIPRDRLVRMIDEAARAAGVGPAEHSKLSVVAATTAAVMVGNFVDICDCPWRQAMGTAKGGGGFAKNFDRLADVYVVAAKTRCASAFYVLETE